MLPWEIWVWESGWKTLQLLLCLAYCGFVHRLSCFFCSVFNIVQSKVTPWCKGFFFYSLHFSSTHPAKQSVLQIFCSAPTPHSNTMNETMWSHQIVSYAALKKVGLSHSRSHPKACKHRYCGQCDWSMMLPDHVQGIHLAQQWCVIRRNRTLNYNSDVEVFMASLP